MIVFLLTLCACTPLQHNSSMAYITNQGDNTVSVIAINHSNGAQGKVINTIKVGKAPGIAPTNTEKGVTLFKGV